MTTPYPLGRIVKHDPRSLRYQVVADGTKATVEWTRRIPILNQGQIGSCTGNAGTGLLGTDPYYTANEHLTLDEAYAVALYSAATHEDGKPSEYYPPHDDGSSGLDIAKVLTSRGLISGYQTITSIDAAYTAIQAGPFITGIPWFEGMFNPDANGVVTISGDLAGGHEICCVGYDVDTDLFKFANSWGTSWGSSGFLFMSSATYSKLLAQQGDATTIVPADQPAPTPTPTPNPTDPDPAMWASIRSWALGKHNGSSQTAANTLRAWASSKSYN